MEPPAVQDCGGVRRQQPQQQAGMGQMLTGVIRIAVFWYFASKFFGPKRSPTQSSTQISNLFHKGELLLQTEHPLVVNFFCQLIVFLYLLDNETSWMILASSGIGCCIEFWKIGKAMHIGVDRTGTIPMLRFRDRDSYATNKTKEYDDLAMKYLTYILLVLAICFSIYSLKYERHKSWYSWILSSLTSCVYMFGFIMMCPQLFINYKLKSVAHLPWRQMTYKFLNTIIDDLFAFVIKMPILHRLSVFRDDDTYDEGTYIFLIYLYQRWKYPVDKKRVNEFG
ncbi:CLPTM1-like membrane protein cnrB [Salvia splendens]|uniref:CLPTM1-like membrane protein cnrB n=1 Tax=Salvia splendens TaxID=180675 RepID=UPI001C278B39|nr:CLPTM1-like membrane protein cnrB [Salvia splendens]